MPWGREPNLTLSWFGLTDGTCHINAGSDQLFRYTDEILSLWNKQDPSFDHHQKYTSYQVVRLYEDLMDNLADILQEIPPELEALTKRHSSIGVSEDEIWKIHESSESDEILDACMLATEWLRIHRRIDTMHLIQGQEINIWRTKDCIHVRWNSNLANIEGTQIWAATQGEHTLSINDFMNEVKGFHDRLMSAMEDRIKDIKKNNPIPHVQINIAALEMEHEERKKTLQLALDREPAISNWKETLESLHLINKHKNQYSNLPQRDQAGLTTCTGTKHTNTDD